MTLLDMVNLDRPRRSGIAPACTTPCAACPWRTANHGRRHPDGWYTKANRDRLWAGMRRGALMSCHPTDPENPTPEGVREVPADVVTRECAGILVLVQREMNLIDRIAATTTQDLARRYRQLRSRGLTLEGITANIHRIMMSRISEPDRFGVLPMTKMDLDLEVSHDPLPWPVEL